MFLHYIVKEMCGCNTTDIEMKFSSWPLKLALHVIKITLFKVNAQKLEASEWNHCQEESYGSTKVWR
jgi:hypothetical protein